MSKRPKRRKRRKLTEAEEDAIALDLPGRYRRSAVELIDYLEANPPERGPIDFTYDMWWELIFLLREYLKQTPPQPLTPRRIARLVDEEFMRYPEDVVGEITYTVVDTRKKIALRINKSLLAVTAAHRKYGMCKGMPGRPKKTIGPK